MSSLPKAISRMVCLLQRMASGPWTDHVAQISGEQMSNEKEMPCRLGLLQASQPAGGGASPREASTQLTRPDGWGAISSGSFHGCVQAAWWSMFQPACGGSCHTLGSSSSAKDVKDKDPTSRIEAGVVKRATCHIQRWPAGLSRLRGRPSRP